MYFRLTAALVGLSFWSLTATANAQTLNNSLPLRYKFAPGQTVRYLIMRDPYFTDPAGAIETTNPNAPYRSPIMERLSEQVQALGPDGNATVKITLEPEPGFEDETKPLPTSVQTVIVSPLGQVLSGLTDASHGEMLRAFFRLPSEPAKPGSAWKGIAFRGTEQVNTSLTLATLRGGSQGLAIITQALPPLTRKSTSPDHDGTLLQTTRSAQTDRMVFDVGAGNLLRQTSTMTVTLSLVMTNRGARGGADFGRVIPNVQVVQTMTIERKDDAATAAAILPPPALLSLPSLVSTARRSGN